MSDKASPIKISTFRGCKNSARRRAPPGRPGESLDPRAPPAPSARPGLASSGRAIVRPCVTASIPAASMTTRFRWATASSDGRNQPSRSNPPKALAGAIGILQRERADPRARRAPARSLHSRAPRRRREQSSGCTSLSSSRSRAPGAARYIRAPRCGRSAPAAGPARRLCPARARSYARLPLIFRAECSGGCCMTVPRQRLKRCSHLEQ